MLLYTCSLIYVTGKCLRLCGALVMIKWTKMCPPHYVVDDMLQAIKSLLFVMVNLGVGQLRCSQLSPYTLNPNNLFTRNQLN